MKCTTIELPAGQKVIVCGRTRIKRCRCKALATKLCDWKVAPGKTCDQPICDACSVSPATGKDLCGKHAITWERWKEWMRNKRQPSRPSDP